MLFKFLFIRFLNAIYSILAYYPFKQVLRIFLDVNFNVNDFVFCGSRSKYDS